MLSQALLFFYCQSPRQQDDNRQVADRTWWKEALVYLVYPRSFKDSDGDDVGERDHFSVRL